VCFAYQDSFVSAAKAVQEYLVLTGMLLQIGNKDDLMTKFADTVSFEMAVYGFFNCNKRNFQFVQFACEISFCAL
jgi:hypothetical protein